jgi:hypothetical protein
MKKIIKKIAIAIGLFVLFIFLAFVAMGLYSVYANKQADNGAIAFCKQVQQGSDIGLAIARAEKEQVRHRTLDDGRLHQFIFYGAIFYGNACELGVANGKVTTIGYHIYDDRRLLAAIQS